MAPFIISVSINKILTHRGQIYQRMLFIKHYNNSMRSPFDIYDVCCSYLKNLYDVCYYGIRNDVLKLICSYLQGRQQYVCFNGVKSTLLEIKRGGPQDSVMTFLNQYYFANHMHMPMIPFLLEVHTIYNSQRLNAMKICLLWCNKNGMVINHNESHFYLLTLQKQH